MEESKKVLFVCQYFYPEVFRGNDVAFHLAKEGYEVHVVTGIPNYPKGNLFKGYGIYKNRHEEINGVKVTRLPIIPRGNNKVMLMLNYFSYVFVACVWMVFHAMGHGYYRVFVQQLSPVMMSLPGILYKRLRGASLYTWVLDLWPDSLTAAGGIKNKCVLKFFDWFVKKEYKWSDKILISSRGFREKILGYGDYEDKIVYFPQWADGNSLDAPPGFELPEIPSGFRLMFAGAVGDAHGFECTMKAALLTKEYKEIKWVIVGDGRKLDWVREFVKEHDLVETVVLLGRYPAETMPLFFEQADVMLVTLNDNPLFNMYSPAKISSYMASCRPIIAVLNGEGGEIIKDAQCGWHIPAGDAEGFAKLAIELSQIDKTVLWEKGANGRVYYEEHFAKEKCLRRLDEIMEL